MNQLGLFASAASAKPAHADHDGLRYYQRDAIQRVMASFEDNNAVLMVMATGLGKTVCFSSIAKSWPGPVVVLAHRTELIDQAAGKLEQMTGQLVDIEQAQLRSRGSRIVVGSVQTLQREARCSRVLRQLAANYPRQTPLVVVDEAHHYVSKTYLKTVRTFLGAGAKVLGVTATPGRADGKALGKVFDDYPVVVDIEDGIDMGYLVPIRGKEVRVAAINLDSVKVTAGDFQQGQLDEEMLKGGEIIAQATLQEAGDRQGIVFCPGVKSAHLVAAKLNALRSGSAASIDGKTDPLERKRITREYRAGKIQYLVNCQVATEGFDAPGCSVVVLARPTKSESLYTQMVGRGTRVLPGTVDHLHGAENSEARRKAIRTSAKKDLLILDVTGESRHSLVCPTDILGGNYSEEEVKKAKKLEEKSPGGDTLSNLRNARNILQEIARKSQARLEAKVRAFDPFNVLEIERDEGEERHLTRFGHQPLTDSQREHLTRKKVPKEVIERMNKSDYTRFSRELKRRQSKGLATYAQMAHLKKFGVEGTNVSFKAATRSLDYIAKRGWGRKKKIDPSVLRKLANSQ